MKQDIYFYGILIILLVSICWLIVEIIPRLKQKWYLTILIFISVGSLILNLTMSIVLYETRKEWDKVEKYELINEPIYRLKK